MTTQPRQPDAFDRLFDWIRSTGIRRRLSNRYLAGVCAGIADRLGIDPMLVRLAFFVLSILGGSGVMLYLVLFSLLADTKGEIPLEKAIRRGDPNSIVLLVVTALSVLSNLSFGFGGDERHFLGWSGSGWLVIGVVAFFIWRKRNRAGGVGGSRPTPTVRPTPQGQAGQRPFPSAQPVHGDARPSAGQAAPTARVPGRPFPAAAPMAPATNAPAAATVGMAAPTAASMPPNPFESAPNPTTAPVARRVKRPTLGMPGVLASLGLAIIAFGATYMSADSSHWTGNHVVLGLAVALGAVSAMVALLGAVGRRAGFPGFVAVLLAGALAVSSGAGQLRLTGNDGWRGASDLETAPTSLANGDSFQTSMGDATLDLRKLDPATLTGQDVTVGSSMGDVTVIVPEDLNVSVQTSTRMGDVTVEDPQGDTSHPGKGIVRVGDGTDLHITAATSMGDVTIKELAR